MTPNLSSELTDALGDNDQITAVDPNTGRVFVIIEQSLFDLGQASKAHEAIKQGLDDESAGRTFSFDEAMNAERKALVSRLKQ